MNNKSAAHIWIQWLAIPVTSVLLSYFIWIWADDHRVFGFNAAWKLFFAFPITFLMVYALSVFLLIREFGEKTLWVLNLSSWILAITSLLYIVYIVVVEQNATRWDDVYDLAGDYTFTSDLNFKPVLGKLGVFSLVFSFIIIVLGIRKNKLLYCTIGFIFILLLLALLFYANAFHPKLFIDGSI